MNGDFHRLIFAAFLIFAVVNANAADKLAIRIGNQTISYWRTADLDAAKKEAAAEHKPIAWIASDPKYLNSSLKISSTGSGGATLHAFYALRSRTVLIFEDGFAGNHKVLQIVDDAVHTTNGQPDHHPIGPKVIFLNPDCTKVLAEVDFESDFVKRAHALADALNQAEEKMKSAPDATKQ